MTADGGIDRWIADLLPPEPQLNAFSHRPLVGHDKGHRRPVRLRHRDLAAYRTGQRRGNQHDRQILQHRKGHRAGQRLWLAGNGQIRFAGDHALYRIGGVAGGEFDFDGGVLGAEPVKDRWQMAVGCRYRAEQAQLAGERRALLVNGVAQLLVLEQGLLGEGAQFVTRLGQGDGAVVSHKQRLAEILLQPLDLTRQRRRADVHRPCAAAKVTALRQVEKDF